MELLVVGIYFLFIVFSIPFFIIYIRNSLNIMKEIENDQTHELEEIEQIQKQLKEILLEQNKKNQKILDHKNE